MNRRNEHCERNNWLQEDQNAVAVSVEDNK